MVKVYIWRTRYPWDGLTGCNSSSANFGPFQLDWGHVALEIPDEDDASNIPKHYMSYWPPEKKKDKYSYYYPDDIATCGEADRIIELYNLDEDAMIEAWENELAKDFDDIEHNCCTVAAAILNAGWDTEEIDTTIKWVWRIIRRPIKTSMMVVRDWGGQNFIWSPAYIERYADYLKLITND